MDMNAPNTFRLLVLACFSDCIYKLSEIICQIPKCLIVHKHMNEVLVGFAVLRGQQSQPTSPNGGFTHEYPPEDAILRCGQVKPAAATPVKTGRDS